MSFWNLTYLPGRNKSPLRQVSSRNTPWVSAAKPVISLHCLILPFRLAASLPECSPLPSCLNSSLHMLDKERLVGAAPSRPGKKSLPSEYQSNSNQAWLSSSVTSVFIFPLLGCCTGPTCGNMCPSLHLLPPCSISRGKIPFKRNIWNSCPGMVFLSLPLPLLSPLPLSLLPGCLFFTPVFSESGLINLKLDSRILHCYP